jgi:hypothetical protein
MYIHNYQSIFDVFVEWDHTIAPVLFPSEFDNFFSYKRAIAEFFLLQRLQYTYLLHHFGLFFCLVEDEYRFLQCNPHRDSGYYKTMCQ